MSSVCIHTLQSKQDWITKEGVQGLYTDSTGMGENKDNRTWAADWISNLNMRFIQVNVCLPQLDLHEIKVSWHQGVFHAIVLTDMKDSIRVLKKATGFQASKVFRIRKMGGWWAAEKWGCCSPTGFWVLLHQEVAPSLAVSLAVKVSYSDGWRRGEYRALCRCLFDGWCRAAAGAWRDGGYLSMRCGGLRLCFSKGYRSLLICCFLIFLSYLLGSGLYAPTSSWESSPMATSWFSLRFLTRK